MYHNNKKLKQLWICMSLLNFGCEQLKLAQDGTDYFSRLNQVNSRREPNRNPQANGQPSDIYNAIVGNDMDLVAELINPENVNFFVSTSVPTSLMTPLEIATCHQHVSATMVEWLIEQGADVTMDLGHGFTVLMRAFTLERHAAAEVLIRHGANLHAVNNYGESIMQYAVLSNDMISLQYLIDHTNYKVIMDTPNHDGRTPLSCLYHSNFCGEYPSYDGVGTPPNAGPDFALPTQDGGTPLHLVAHFCSIFSMNEVVTKLIEKGYDINAKNNLGNTPLHNAVTSGRVHVVNILLQQQASIDVKNNNQETPLTLARRLNNPEIVDLLRVWGL